MTARLMWLSLAAMAAGCPRGPYTPIEQAGGGPAHQTRHGVTMMDQNVRNALLLRSNNATLTPGGQIQARITFQNAYDEDLFVDVRFVFFNEADEPVDVGQWRTVHLAPQDLVMVEGNSIRSGLAKYNLQVRNLCTRSGKKLTSPGIVYENGLWVRAALPR